MSRIEDGGAVEAGRIELVRNLWGGCVTREKRWSGDTFSDLGSGVIDESATDQIMAQAADQIESDAAEITRLRAENEIMRKAIAWANNSLYGSHGFFLSTNGGRPDEHHLDRPIEDLKSVARKAHLLRAENAGMREALDGIANKLSALRMQAEKDGGGRDGRLGAFLSNDIAYLIRIAALSNSSQAEGQTP